MTDYLNLLFSGESRFVYEHFHTSHCLSDYGQYWRFGLPLECLSQLDELGIDLIERFPFFITIFFSSNVAYCNILYRQMIIINAFLLFSFDFAFSLTGLLKIENILFKCGTNTFC